MSKATCIADQIGFLWRITCKHTVSNLAQKHSFATGKNPPRVLGWGLTTSPATPVGTRLLQTTIRPHHHVCWGRFLLDWRDGAAHVAAKVLQFLTASFLVNCP